jgi:hypothetical protein
VAVKAGLYDDGKLYWTGEDIENPGCLVPVALDCLIERIYVSPTAQAWFTELVERVVTRYGLAKEVKQSTLDEGPLY